MALRLFVALDPPGDLRRALLEASAALRRDAGAAAGRFRWAGAEQLHLTLRFLGDVEEAALDGVRRAVREAADAGRPLDLEVRGAGAFPSARRARVAWLGLGGEVGPLGALVTDLGARLERAGIPRERRPFTPHLTLGRSRQPRGAAGLAAALERAAAAPARPWRAEVLTLFRSHLEPGGARHQPLLQAPLGGGRAGAGRDRGEPARTTRYALPQPYEDLDHTADVGVRVRGASAGEALARLALALGTLLGGGDAAAPAVEARLAVAGGPDLAGTAVALLRELLFRFATARLFPAQVELHRVDEAGAEATVGFARYDPARHAEGVDVKAVTWHAARLEPEGGGWVAQAVFDV